MSNFIRKHNNLGKSNRAKRGAWGSAPKARSANSVLKGFMFGAIAMLITPALAIQSDAIETDAPAPIVQEQYFRLTYEDAEAAIAAALTERGAGAKVAANIVRKNNDCIFSYSNPISVEIRGLRFDEKTSRFTTNLVSIAGDKVISAVAVSGSYDEMVEVPVLKRDFKAGETITSKDIELRDYTKARVRINTINDMASLIGKSPERAITAGRPIREHELAEPILVKKNDLVKMQYNNGNMRITTNGQAIDGGTEGATISVRNLTSKKIVQARIQDATTVVINDGKTQAIRLTNEGTYAAN